MVEWLAKFLLSGFFSSLIVTFLPIVFTLWISSGNRFKFSWIYILFVFLSPLISIFIFAFGNKDLAFSILFYPIFITAAWFLMILYGLIVWAVFIGVLEMIFYVPSVIFPKFKVTPAKYAMNLIQYVVK